MKIAILNNGISIDGYSFNHQIPIFKVGESNLVYDTETNEGTIEVWGVTQPLESIEPYQAIIDEFMPQYHKESTRPNPFYHTYDGTNWVINPQLKKEFDIAQIDAQISQIEQNRQPRAQREAILGLDGAKARLSVINDEISALRAQRVELINA